MEVGSATQPSYLPHLFVSDGSKSVEYNEKTMEEALKKVEEMDADLGGTEILEPLKHIYSQPCVPSQPRQVIHTQTHTHTLCTGDSRCVSTTSVLLSPSNLVYIKVSVNNRKLNS